MYPSKLQPVSFFLFSLFSPRVFISLSSFEKMLYDQGQLAVAYLEAYQVSRDPLFSAVANDILAYVNTNLRDEMGGFYCAEDADSKETHGATEAIEGAFYAWTYDDLLAVLDETEELPLFAFRYGVEKTGNVPAETDIQGELAGKNILFEKHTLAETAKLAGKSEEETRALLDSCRKKVYQQQQQRPRPNLDDKIITAWNGLVISAFCKAHQILGDAGHLATAVAAAEFFWETMYDQATKVLYRSYRHGHSTIEGYSDDYAYFIQALLDLYESTFDEKWLRWATDLQQTQDSLFWDSQAYGYFSCKANDPAIIVRMKEDSDGAEPSANSVSALNLFRIASLLDDSAMAEKANLVFVANSSTLQQSPSSLSFMASVLLIYLRSSFHILIVGEKDHPDTKKMLDAVNRHYIPNRILMSVPPFSSLALQTLTSFFCSPLFSQSHTGWWIPRRVGRVCCRRTTL